MLRSHEEGMESIFDDIEIEQMQMDQLNIYRSHNNKISDSWESLKRRREALFSSHLTTLTCQITWIFELLFLPRKPATALKPCTHHIHHITITHFGLSRQIHTVIPNDQSDMIITAK